MIKKEYPILKESKLLHLKFSPPLKGQSSFNDELRIVFLIKGSSTYYTPNGSTELNPGNIIVFNNDNFINEWKASNEDCEVLVFRIKADLLNEIYKSSKLKQSKPESQPPFIVFSFKMIEQFFVGFKNYLDQQEYLTQELVILKLRELIYILSKKKEFISFMDHIDFDAARNNFEFRNIVFSNLYNPINVEELSFLCNMSLSTFQRKFKYIYKTTPAKYIETERIKRAKLLLVESESSIADICYQVGYTQLSHFSKVFKKNYNISPNAYRKMYAQ